MANPQLEDGHIRIANELLEAILRYPGLTGLDLKVVFYVIRHTYGWQRKKAQISFGEISKAASCDRSGTRKSVLRLVQENILFVQHTVGDENANIIGLNKDYDSWQKNIKWETK